MQTFFLVFEKVVLSCLLFLNFILIILYYQRRNIFPLKKKFPRMKIICCLLNLLLTFVLYFQAQISQIFNFNSNYTLLLLIHLFLFSYCELSFFILIFQFERLECQRNAYLYYPFEVSKHVQSLLNSGVVLRKPNYKLRKLKLVLILVAELIHASLFCIDLFGLMGMPKSDLRLHVSVVGSTTLFYCLIVCLLAVGVMIPQLKKLSAVPGFKEESVFFCLSSLSFVSMLLLTSWKENLLLNKEFFAQYGLEPMFVFFLPANFLHALSALMIPLYFQKKLKHFRWKRCSVYDTMSLETFLKDNRKFRKIRRIASKLFCVELLDFWAVVTLYKNTDSNFEANKLAKEIFDCFIRSESNFAIEISLQNRKAIYEIERKASLFSKDRKVFDEMLTKVLDIILENVYNLYMVRKKLKL